MNVFPEINTDNCVLTRLSIEDVTNLKEIFDDEQTIRYIPEIYELISLNDGIARFLSVFDYYLAQDEGILWGIRNNKVLIGFIAIMDLSSDTSLFYAMHPIYRSCGFMKESVKAVIDFVIRNELCSCIQSEVFKNNVVSISLLKSFGFKIIGVYKDKFCLKRQLLF